MGHPKYLESLPGR